MTFPASIGDQHDDLPLKFQAGASARAGRVRRIGHSATERRAMKQIELTQGKVALVSDRDYRWLSQWKWRAERSEHGQWYARGLVGTNTVRMHRLILGAPDGVEVDHRDRDGLNNVRSNLRLASGSQNRQNIGKHRNNTSGYKGVTWHLGDQLWHAKINVNGVRIHLGSFTTPSRAAIAYDAAARKYHGKFARTNY